MSRPHFMRNITNQGTFIKKTTCDLLNIVKVASTVISHIDNKPLADGQPVQHLVETTLTHITCEAAIIDIAHIVFKNLIPHSGNPAVLIFFAEIVLLNG